MIAQIYLAYLLKFVSQRETSAQYWPEILQIHYWRMLKASKFNAVHCDLSTGAAWLIAALCFWYETGSFRRGLDGRKRGLKAHSEEFLCHMQSQAFHISVEGAKLPSR